MKRYFALLLTLVVGLMCVGCNAQEQAQPTQTAQTTQSTTIQTTVSEGFLPQITDEALVQAVDLYVRITMQNDTKALDELPVMLWSFCRNTKEEYAAYMQQNPLDKSFEGQWQILSVGNPFGDNSFEVQLSLGDQTQTLTLTQQEGMYIMDEMMFYFDAISSVLNG